MENKKVSVVIPTYNCGKYISESVESVLNQTYKNFEIIIVDDGSSDNTRGVLAKYLDENGNKIKYFYQENSGGTVARNHGIKESQGDYIAFFDADDLWTREKLEKSIDFMEKNGFDWVCTALKKVDMQKNVLEERTIKPNAYGYNPKTGEIFDMIKGLFYSSKALPVHTNTQVMKKECFEKSGLLDETLLICENTELCIRFQETGLKGGFLNEMLTIYRTHDQSITKSNKVDGLKYVHIVAKRYAKKYGLSSPAIRRDYANHLWELASRYYTNKKWLETLKFSVLSLTYNLDRSRITKIMKYLYLVAVPRR